MAEPARTSLRPELKELIYCSLCQNVYKSPVILPCMHTFCKECAENQVNIRTVESKEQDRMIFNCPTCRSNLEIPGDDINTLPPNDFLNNVKNILATLTGAEVPCGFCVHEDQYTKAAWLCANCAEPMCAECKSFHPRQGPRFRDHRVIQLQDCENDDVADICSQKREWCKTHSTKELEFYCKDCDMAVCSNCQVVGHQDHPCVDVKWVAAEKKKDLIRDEEDIKKIVQQNKEDLQRLNTQMRMVEESRQRAIDGIRADNAKIIYYANQQCAQLESDVNSISDSNAEKVSSMIKDTQSNNASLQIGLTLNDGVSKFGRNVDIIDMSSRLSKMLHQHNTSSLPTNQSRKSLIKTACYQASALPLKAPSDFFGKCSEVPLSDRAFDRVPVDEPRYIVNVPERTYRKRLYHNRLQMLLILLGLCLAVGYPFLIYDQNQPTQNIQMNDHKQSMQKTQINDQNQSKQKTQINDQNQSKQKTQINNQNQSEQKTQINDQNQSKQKTQINDHNQSEQKTQINDQNQSKQKTQINKNNQSKQKTQTNDQNQSKQKTQINDQNQSEQKTQTNDQNQSKQKTQINDQNQSKQKTQINDQNQSKQKTQINDQNQSKQKTQINDQNQSKQKTQINDQNQSKQKNQTNDQNQSKQKTQINDQNQSKQKNPSCLPTNH